MNSAASRGPSRGWLMIILYPSSMQVGLVAHAFFVDQVARDETIKAHLRGGRVRFVLGQQMGITKTAGGCGFEAAIAPATVEIEAFDPGLVDERRAIHRHVHDPAPRAQKPRAPDHRHD